MWWDRSPDGVHVSWHVSLESGSSMRGKLPGQSHAKQPLGGQGPRGGGGWRWVLPRSDGSVVFTLWQWVLERSPW